MISTTLTESDATNQYDGFYEEAREMLRRVEVDLFARMFPGDREVEANQLWNEILDFCELPF